MSKKEISRGYYIAMSTLMLPGLGQCALKKWIPGILYALGFLISALISIMTLLGPLVKNLMMLTDFAEQGEMEPTAWGRVFFFLGATVLIYIANTVDIIVRTKKDGFKDVSPEGPVPPGPNS